MTAMPTDREQQILRLLEAGIQLKHRANQGQRYGAVFDFDRVPASVLRPTLVKMLNEKLIEFDESLQQYRLTALGRDRVAVRTRVRDFALNNND